mmetsp:Transcript_70619/g.117268  ORF Transcript_70619/g.117268 Transcript_70619/m.117268 type:complete len:186 (-) Transcript_70619:169-726(-)|eukprot:CAMPEP_0119309092 /NCGR_PEP_ID=MMETSP1333-20130426/14247_1 /TAXON_ID=418940 /ORGANISM="Scyphosphaera apsteinii, Strain RCC1455" /LENGTH=185 /DNA_ID=CAMNT_0007313009 /DNA_START=44 /DNA_END=601 /DNA_ORIENTATION=-
MTREDKIFQLAKGSRGRAKNCWRIAIRHVEKGLQNSYRDRRLKKRDARQVWITQIAAASMEHGLSYSKFTHGIKLANIGLDRKVLSILAQQEPYSFRAIVEHAKGALRESVLGFKPTTGTASADSTVGESPTALPASSPVSTHAEIAFKESNEATDGTEDVTQLLVSALQLEEVASRETQLKSIQ